MFELKTLAKFKLYKEIDEKELIELFKKIKYEIKKIKKSDIVFFREEKIDGLFIILKGVLSAEMLKDNGDIQKIENLSGGYIIGSDFILGNENNLHVDLIVLEEC